MSMTEAASAQKGGFATFKKSNRLNRSIIWIVQIAEIIPLIFYIISLVLGWIIVFWISAITLCIFLCIHFLYMAKARQILKTGCKKRFFAFNIADITKGYVLLGIYVILHILWICLIIFLIKESISMCMVSFIKFIAILVLLLIAVVMSQFMLGFGFLVKRPYTEVLEKTSRYQRIFPRMMKEVYTQCVKEELVHLEDSVKEENSYTKEKIVRVKQLMADDKIEQAFDIFDGLGYCHKLWRIQKRILLIKYGIIWFSPEECNPWVIYD